MVAWPYRWDGPKADPVGEASNANFDEDNVEGDSEASTRDGVSDDGRKKFFRKTRKKSKSPTRTDRGRGLRRDSTSSDATDVESDADDDDDERQSRGGVTGKRHRTRRTSGRAASSSIASKNSDNDSSLQRQPRGRSRASSKRGSGRFFRSRTNSSPSGLDITEYLASRTVKKNQLPDQASDLPSCQPIAIRLESRLTRDNSFSTPTRPKLLALGDGSVSVEPRVRKSLTFGTPVRSQSVCFGSIGEATQDLPIGSLSEATETLRGQLAQEIIRGIERNDNKKKRKKKKKDRKEKREAEAEAVAKAEAHTEAVAENKAKKPALIKSNPGRVDI